MTVEPIIMLTFLVPIGIVLLWLISLLWTHWTKWPTIQRVTVSLAVGATVLMIIGNGARGLFHAQWPATPAFFGLMVALWAGFWLLAVAVRSSFLSWYQSKWAAVFASIGIGMIIWANYQSLLTPFIF
ncbi:MAG: hypothetical protein OWS74_03810 [Firmicutes bacterium]|nr:hypothetical protein [Bacillota bacterium]